MDVDERRGAAKCFRIAVAAEVGFDSFGWRSDRATHQRVPEPVRAQRSHDGSERIAGERFGGPERECVVARDGQFELQFGATVCNAVTLIRLSGLLINKPFTITL